MLENASNDRANWAILTFLIIAFARTTEVSSGFDGEDSPLLEVSMGGSRVNPPLTYRASLKLGWDPDLFTLPGPRVTLGDLSKDSKIPKDFRPKEEKR